MSIKSLPYDLQAYRNEPVPDSLNPFDKLAYMALRGLYSSYRNNEISKDQATKEKRAIIKTLENALFDDKINQYSAKVIKATERNRRDYRHERTLEAADRLVDVFDGLSREGLEN